MIEIDMLLSGFPQWEEVVEFFRGDDFREERHFIAAIRRYLLSEDDERGLDARDLTIEDMVSGNWDESQEEYALGLFRQWNQKLGFQLFMEL